MKKQNKKETKKKDVGGSVFVGSLMIGMGLGFYYNHLVVGLFLGMGVGFILSGIINAIYNKKN